MAIERILKYVNRRHYHWYAGSELNFFRYPDEELLITGSNLSGSDLEIIRRIYKGMQNEDIARKLFLSPLTIYTHRRNILRKTGKSNIHEVNLISKELGLFELMSADFFTHRTRC